MELLGLIWAASLPHQNAAIYVSQAALTLEVNNSSGPVREQQTPIPLDLNLSYQGELHLPLVLPTGFQPQFQWQGVPRVDWDHWEMTATATVLPAAAVLNQSALETGKTTKGSPISRTSLACPSQAEAVAQQLGKAAFAPEEGAYAIQVNRVTLGTLPTQAAAEAVASQLRQALEEVEANPSDLKPQIGGGVAAAGVNGKTVFELTNDLVSGSSSNLALIATAWVNTLRHMFEAPPLGLSEMQMVLQGLGETHQVISGTASWYGPYFHGRQTATGEVFNQHELTAAHKTLPFGTQLKVRNLLNDRTVVVRINDRGPYIGDRSLDLSYAAAQCLGSETVGVIPYEATILEPGVPTAWKAEAPMAQQ